MKHSKKKLTATYGYQLLEHQVIVQYRVVVYLNRLTDHDLKQAMLLVSKFQNRYYRNNVKVKMDQMVLDPKSIEIISNK